MSVLKACAVITILVDISFSMNIAICRHEADKSHKAVHSLNYFPSYNIGIHIGMYLPLSTDYGRLDEDMAERMSSMRKPHESEMDFYERRYQERASGNMYSQSS